MNAEIKPQHSPVLAELAKRSAELRSLSAAAANHTADAIARAEHLRAAARPHLACWFPQTTAGENERSADEVDAGKK